MSSKDSTLYFSMTEVPKNNVNLIDKEFKYYGAVLRNLIEALKCSINQERAISWINKLSAPEYHIEVLKDKRNRYLASFVVNIINDELMGIFKNDPPSGTTKDLTNIQIISAFKSEWEMDQTWSDYVDCLDDEYKQIPCSFHDSDESCKLDSSDNDKQLDNEFRFLLYEIRPYAALIPFDESKTKAAAWIQTLCRIGTEKCTKMKNLRNEYAYALFGYVHDLRVTGPFQDYPPQKMLQTLKEASEDSAKNHPLTSPFCEEAESFICEQPKPEEGAFCYMAVTGELAQSSDLF